MKFNLTIGELLTAHHETLDLKDKTSFHHRLQLLVDCAGNPNAFSKITKLSVSGLKRYLSGGDITISKLMQISTTTGVKPLWLMTGDGDIAESVTKRLELQHDPQNKVANLVTDILNVDESRIDSACLNRIEMLAENYKSNGKIAINLIAAIKELLDIS